MVGTVGYVTHRSCPVMNRSRSNRTVSPSSSGLNLSSMPANASSKATMRGQVAFEDEYSALAAANSGMWIAAEFSPPDISERFFLVSRSGGLPGGGLSEERRGGR